MQIDPDLCIGCGQCLPYCPVKAIRLEGDVSEIDLDECAECGNCLRSSDCPVDAIYQQDLEWPRTVRSISIIRPDGQLGREARHAAGVGVRGCQGPTFGSRCVWTDPAPRRSLVMLRCWLLSIHTASYTRLQVISPLRCATNPRARPSRCRSCIRA